jgi:hypothetical protein
LPPIFHNNPDLYSSFLTYAKSNLSTLSGEMLHEYLHTVALPETVKKIKNVRKLNEYTIQDFLKENNLCILCPRTIYIWLKQLGFVYLASAKSYYIDSHKKLNNVQY